MTDFDRRSFLGSMFAAAGFAAMPEWLSGSMAPQDPAASPREKQLRAAAQRAKDEGKPLLVLLAPSGGGDAAEVRGQWLGAWLNHGGERALHAVALCVLACASRDEVQRVLGVSIDGQPLLAILECGAYGEPSPTPPRATWTKLDVATLELPRPGRLDEEAMARQRAIVEAGLAKIHAEVQDLQNRHGATVARVARDSMARLPAASQQALAAWFAGGAAPAAEIVVRAAAEVRRVAGSLEGEARSRMLDALTAAVMATVVRPPVPGSRWKILGGCGDVFEPVGEEQPMPGVACGMGSVPPLCERFLHLYSAGN